MRVKRVQVIPTFVSLANILFGFASIIYSARALEKGLDNSEGLFALYVAAMCVGFAMVADLLDGRIARMTGGDSAFGAEMDSLSDVVSFGIAPAVMVKVMVDSTPAFPNRVGWALAGAYVAFVAMRLARYNVEKDVQPGERFSGLPSPAAAGAVISLVMLYAHISISPKELAWTHLSPETMEAAGRVIVGILPVYMLIVGVLMVTRVRYSHLGRIVLSGRKPFPHLVILALAAVFAFIELPLTLAAGFSTYVLAGLGLELYARLAHKEEPKAATAVSEEELAEGPNDTPGA